MLVYHFSDAADITKFKHTKPRRSYSCATGKGIYFAIDLAKGQIVYGSRAKYMYRVQFSGTNILNLGEFDAVYFKENRLIHSGDIHVENFKRQMNGLPLLKQPDVILSKINKRAYDKLISRGIQAVMGQDGWGYACPEMAVIDENTLRIIDIQKLHE